MQIIKKLALFMAATTATIVFISWSLCSFGVRSFVSALVINWMVLSWFATVTLVADVSLPSAYYNAKSFERTGKCYERVGIRVVKKFLRRGPLRIFSPTLRFPKKKTVAALWHLENEMRKAETAHVLTFIFILLIVGHAAISGWLNVVIWMLLFNVLINIYPIMLQRYNRNKLQEFIQKQDSEATVELGM